MEEQLGGLVSAAKSWVVSIFNFIFSRIARTLGFEQQQSSICERLEPSPLPPVDALRMLLTSAAASASSPHTSDAKRQHLLPFSSETERFVERLTATERLAVARSMCNDLSAISSIKPTDFLHTHYLEVLAAMCKTYPDVLHIVAHDCETLALLVDACKSQQPQARDILERVLDDMTDDSSSVLVFARNNHNNNNNGGEEEEEGDEDARLIVALLHAICVVKGPSSLAAAVERLPNVFALLQAQLEQDDKARMRCAVVLRNLTSDATMCTRMFETPRLVESLLASCNRKHSSLTRENAFAVLFRICNTPGNTDRMFAREGVVSFLLDSTELSVDASEPSWACEWAVVILLVLLNSSDAIKTALMASDRAVKALCMASMAPQSTNKNDRVREWATGGLMVLASGESNRRAAFKLLDQFVLLTNEGSNEGVKHHALLGLATLALDSDNLREMKRSKTLLFSLMDATSHHRRPKAMMDEEVHSEAKERNRSRAKDLLHKLGFMDERAQTVRVLLAMCSSFDVPRLGSKCAYRSMDRHLLRKIAETLL